MTRPTWLSWSSGKDSAWALHVLRDDPEVDVVGLVTTLNTEADRVAMHGVRRELLRAQADRAGLPLVEVELPWPCSDEQYQERMAAVCQRAEREGVEAMAFGDLHLEDVRAYREQQLAPTNLTPLFPLWGLHTRKLAEAMIASGLRATLACVDTEQIPAELLGRLFDAALLADLPEGADPCGERGEFHTLVHDGPMFAGPIAVETGEVVPKGRFHFVDIVPAP